MLLPTERSQRGRADAPTVTRLSRLPWRLRAPAAGHVAANLNVGNDRRTPIAAITQLPFIRYPRTLNALRVINEAT